MADSDSTNAFCPRCGTGKPPAMNDDAGTTLDESGELVEELPSLNVEAVHWFRIAQGVYVCPDCQTPQERLADEGRCIRCGKSGEDDGDGDYEGWIDPDDPGDGPWLRVCSECVTEPERREEVLNFLEVNLRALEMQKAEGERIDPGFYESAEIIMRQRGVPNRLHWEYPTDPLSDEPDPWDAIPVDLQGRVAGLEILRIFADPKIENETGKEINKEEAAREYAEKIEPVLRAYILAMVRQRAEEFKKGPA